MGYRLLERHWQVQKDKPADAECIMMNIPLMVGVRLTNNAINETQYGNAIKLGELQIN